MKKSILILLILVCSASIFGQDHYEKKYTLGQQSGGKWYKLMNIDLNGNGNYNSVNITVDFHYVNTWTKYNANAILRLRENSNCDWQYMATGINQPALKFKKISSNIFELWGYSNGGWGHLSFTALVTKEAPFILTIPETPIVSPNIDQLEDVTNKGDWYFPSGKIEIVQDDNPNEDKGLVITEKNNSQKIALHLADNASGEYGYLLLGGKTTLRGNGQPSFFEGKVGIGTTTPDAKLTVNGNIHAKEVKIDLNVPAPDYVFLKDYDLKTINEVAAYIKEKGHLPNIPSATEMETNGVELGLMNMKLLEKIEELTLYTIAQEKQLEAQQDQIHKLNQDNEKLRSSDSRLQTLTTKNKELEARLVKIEALLNK